MNVGYRLQQYNRSFGYIIGLNHFRLTLLDWPRLW